MRNIIEKFIVDFECYLKSATNKSSHRTKEREKLSFIANDDIYDLCTLYIIWYYSYDIKCYIFLDLYTPWIVILFSPKTLKKLHYTNVLKNFKSNHIFLGYFYILIFLKNFENNHFNQN